jgi:hypothetical protein
MIDSVILIAKKIINELSLGYGLSEIDYVKLLNMLKNIKVSIIKHADREIRYDFYTETDKLYGTYTAKQFGQSHTVEYPPILKNNTIIPILPIINIQHYNHFEEFISSSYHELVHFFSIGEWIIIAENNRETIVEHYSGIIKKLYIYSGSNITCHSSSITLLNEVITDWIAQFLYEKIEKDTYHTGWSYRKTPIYNFLSNKIQTEGQAKAFIGAYLTNKIDVLGHYLLSEPQFENFEKLNSLK